ncbi:Uncharacterised protein [Dorea longicatena]|nr:Uncharacterised protein [Dorea longicatena]
MFKLKCVIRIVYWWQMTIRKSHCLLTEKWKCLDLEAGILNQIITSMKA